MIVSDFPNRVFTNHQTHHVCGLGLFFFTTVEPVVGFTAATAAVVPPTWTSAGSWGAGGSRPPPSSGFSNATPKVPIRTQLKSTANTGFFSVCASMLKHKWTLRPTKYTLLNFKQTRLRVQAGGKIGTHMGRGFLPICTTIMVNDQYNNNWWLTIDRLMMCPTIFRFKWRN